MRANLRYLLYVLRHKWHVARGGQLFGVSWWRIVKHDWSKFTPAEWRPYVDRFFRDRQSDKFQVAWLHHVRWNDHHWQHWIMPAKGGFRLWMPEPAAREMVADWYGAGYAINGHGDLGTWFRDNRDSMDLHFDTLDFVAGLILEHVTRLAAQPRREGTGEA